jgi:hypothetical protein
MSTIFTTFSSSLSSRLIFPFTSNCLNIFQYVFYICNNQWSIYLHNFHTTYSHWIKCIISNSWITARMWLTSTQNFTSKLWNKAILKYHVVASYCRKQLPSKNTTYFSMTYHHTKFQDRKWSGDSVPPHFSWAHGCYVGYWWFKKKLYDL